MTRRSTFQNATLALALGGLLASAAYADITGDYDGQMTGPKLSPSLRASAVFENVPAGAKTVTGTVAVDGDQATTGGAYLVTGTASAKKFKVHGQNQSGANMTFAGKIAGTTMKGKAKLKASGKPVKGTISLTLNVSSTDGSACDGVYNANSQLFADQVMGVALEACTTCHIPGGQSEAARFRITAGDPLATARSVARMVDASNPSASRILQKPLLELPHGGNQQIAAGSNEEMILMDWVQRVAGHCQ